MNTHDVTWRAVALRTLGNSRLWGANGSLRGITWQDLEAVLEDVAREEARHEVEDAKPAKERSLQSKARLAQMRAAVLTSADQWFASPGWWEERQAEVEGRRVSLAPSGADEPFELGPPGELPSYHPPAKQLADAIRTGKPISPEMCEYVAGRLDGTITVPRGPKPASLRQRQEAEWRRMWVRGQVHRRISVLGNYAKTPDRWFRTLFLGLYPRFGREVPRPSVAAAILMYATDIVLPNPEVPQDRKDDMIDDLIGRLEKSYYPRRDRR